MAERPDNNLENVRSMALRLLEDLDNYAAVQELAEAWFSDPDEKTIECLEGIRNGWGEQKIKSPPSYVPQTAIPTREDILQLSNADELDNCIEILMTAIRFLRLLGGGVENELPPVQNFKLNVEIIGDDIDKIEQVSQALRKAILKVLPFATSSHFYSEKSEPVHETIQFRYIEGYDRELQDAVIRTRIAIIAQNLGFEFDEEKMVINL